VNETDIYKRIRPWAMSNGIILRIENSVSQGTVDSIMFYHGLALMMELKVMKARKIKVRRFQISTAVEYTKIAVPNSQYNFVCGSPDVIDIELYPVSILKNAPYTITSNDELSFSLKTIKPSWVWKNKHDFDEWLDQFNDG
jgi:hypothetical protein